MVLVANTMHKTHCLKFKGLELCDAVYEGRKSYEIRKNDRDYQVGDIIRPIPLDDNLNAINHPIAQCTYVITFMSDKYEGVIADDYCVFGIARVEEGTS